MRMNFRDFYYIKILGRHKHHFKNIGLKSVDVGELGIFTYSVFVCLGCGRKRNLDQWQIDDLPSDMLYEKIEK